MRKTVMFAEIFIKKEEYRMKSLTTALISFFILILPDISLACPCLAIEADGESKANFVFTGEVIDIDKESSEYQRTTFKIHSSKKGPSSGTVEVVSNIQNDTGCSARFKIGEKYKIYTYEYEYLIIETMKKRIAKHYTNACSRKKVL